MTLVTGHISRRTGGQVARAALVAGDRARRAYRCRAGLGLVARHRRAGSGLGRAIEALVAADLAASGARGVAVLHRRAADGGARVRGPFAAHEGTVCMDVAPAACAAARAAVRDGHARTRCVPRNPQTVRATAISRASVDRSAVGRGRGAHTWVLVRTGRVAPVAGRCAVEVHAFIAVAGEREVNFPRCRRHKDMCPRRPGSAPRRRRRRRNRGSSREPCRLRRSRSRGSRRPPSLLGQQATCRRIPRSFPPIE